MSEAPKDDQKHEEMRDRFADFERGVLQDNIILCDQKAGILLAFAAAMILVSLEGFSSPEVRKFAAMALVARGAFVVSALAFLASSSLALATVVPRIRKGPDDHIFWESPVFKLPVDQYVASFRDMDVERERENRLRYLHTMAAICRSKYRHFAAALRLGQLGFIALVAAEIAQAFS
jgi:hypothetical protein